MSEGILSGLGLEDVGALPDNVYDAYVTDAKVVNSKDPAKGKFLVLTYTINAEGTPQHKEEISEFKSINSFDEPRQKKFLKARLDSLGVPESRYSTFQPGDVVGLAVKITVKTKGQFTNVVNLELRNENGDVPATPAATTGGNLDALL